MLALRYEYLLARGWMVSWGDDDEQDGAAGGVAVLDGFLREILNACLWWVLLGMRRDG